MAKYELIWTMPNNNEWHRTIDALNDQHAVDRALRIVEACTVVGSCFELKSETETLTSFNADKVHVEYFGKYPTG